MAVLGIETRLKSLDVISAGLKGSVTATAVAAGNHRKP